MTRQPARPLDAADPGFLAFFRVPDVPASEVVPFPAPASDHVPAAAPDRHPALAFLSADQCGACHNAAQRLSGSRPDMWYPDPLPSDHGGRDYRNFSPYGEWSASINALAARDPVWHAQVENERILRPQLDGFTVNVCFSCHGPLGGRQLQIDRGDPDAAFTLEMFYAREGEPGALYGALAREGVSCTTCHRVEATGLGSNPPFDPENPHGHLDPGQLQTYTAQFHVDPAKPLYGPYATAAVIAGIGCVVGSLAGLIVSAPGRAPAASTAPAASSGAPAAAADPCPPLGVEQLLGRDGCREHQRQIEGLVVGGKTYTWAQYASWGGELFREGSVEHPPVGPAPSAKLSQIADYTCDRCHNDAREDRVLTRQDPEARFAYIQGPPARPLKMTQGTTFWGAVNRRTFYNDIYAPYRNLCVPLASSYPDPSKLSCGPTKDGCGPGCRAMDAPLLADAVQVCGKYCSVGRYLTDWELASILTFFWDLQVPLSEVDLTPARRARVERILTDPRAPEPEKEAARRELAGSFLLAAGETRRDAPPPMAAGTPRPEATDPALIRHLRQFGEPRGTLMQVPADRVVLSEEDPEYEPDTPARARGQKLYGVTCGHCHGPGLDGQAQIGGRGHRYLAGTRYLFYEVLENGTAQAANIPYMPEFPLERMSYRQASELLDYLRSLPPAGRLPVPPRPPDTLPSS